MMDHETNVTRKTVEITANGASGLCRAIGTVKWNETVIINGIVQVRLIGDEQHPELELYFTSDTGGGTVRAGKMTPHEIEKTIALAYGYALAALHATTNPLDPEIGTVVIALHDLATASMHRDQGLDVIAKSYLDDVQPTPEMTRMLRTMRDAITDMIGE